MHSLCDREVLEQREIETVKTRTVELRRRPADGAVIGLSDRRRYRRSFERSGIQPLIYIVRTRGDTLARNQEGVATIVGGGAGSAGHGARLAALQGQNPVGAPSAHDRIHHSSAIRKELSPMADRNFIQPAKMKDVGDVEITEPVIALYANPRK